MYDNIINLNKLYYFRAPLGKNISQQVTDMGIRCPSGFFNKLFEQNK
jgi:hypothetical protein